MSNNIEGKVVMMPYFGSFDSRRTGKFLVVTGLVLIGLVGCNSSKPASAPPPPTVEVASVIQQDVPIYTEWVATLDGYVNAQIQPRVSGYIIRQNYKEGSVVKKGQVL